MRLKKSFRKIRTCWIAIPGFRILLNLWCCFPHPPRRVVRFHCGGESPDFGGMHYTNQTINQSNTWIKPLKCFLWTFWKNLLERRCWLPVSVESYSSSWFASSSRKRLNSVLWSHSNLACLKRMICDAWPWPEKMEINYINKKWIENKELIIHFFTSNQFTFQLSIPSSGDQDGR